MGKPSSGCHSRNDERRARIQAEAKTLGLYIREYGDDEGNIQARIFRNPKSDFFFGDHIYHARNRGIREIELFLAGYRAGKESEGWRKG